VDTLLSVCASLSEVKILANRDIWPDCGNSVAKKVGYPNCNSRDQIE
jgi:hypothetical protein